MASVVYNLCDNLNAVANVSGPGLVSDGYKPGGKRPNETTSTPTTGSGSGAATVQMALSTAALALFSLGLAMTM